MLAIKNNLMAENAARHLGTSYDSLAKSVERLSSGLRINSAKDDAAGLAVRELIRADVATLRQGARNAQDGISMLQTAEGALGAVDSILVRMKELAEQAATGSYSETQRSLLDQEFTELAKEITRIAETTDFNGVKLLQSTDSYEIHLGSTDASAETKVTIAGQLMDAGTLELSATKEYAIFTKQLYAGANDDCVGVADGGGGDGTVTFEFTGDTDDDGNAMGAISITIAADGGDGSDDDTYTVGKVVEMLNAASNTAQSGYKIASLSYNTDTGHYSVKLSAYKTGNMTNFTAGGTATLTTGSDFNVTGNWDITDGTDTGQSIATQSGAITALDKVDEAIITKDTLRAEFGYMMKRLDSASTVISIQAENLLTAESRISDVDVATEMAAMTRNQVLAQAGISMLAQANTMPQMALSLLQG